MVRMSLSILTTNASDKRAMSIDNEDLLSSLIQSLVEPRRSGFGSDPQMAGSECPGQWSR